MNKPKLGPELFYLDKDGKKQDASLHEEMLSGTPADEARRLAMTRKSAKKLGMSQAAINHLFRRWPRGK